MTLYIDGVETEIAPNIINELLRGYADWRKLLGPEKVTNGGFTGAATGWTLGAGWTYNANAVDRDGAGTATLTQDVGAVAGELYKVVFALTAYTDGSVTPSIGGVSGDAVSSAITSTQYILATGTGVLTFTPTAGATFTLDNVSVKKVGYVSVDGITLWIDDRGATAGKGALHMMTEDGSRYVFGDRMGFGTFNPASAVEMLGDLNINIGARLLTLTHGITAARTITFPDITDTVVTLTALQTLTGKTLGGNLDLAGYLLSNSFEAHRASLREFAEWAPIWLTQTLLLAEVVSGTGTTDPRGTEVALVTGTTHASTAGRFHYIRMPQTADGNGIDWNRKLSLDFILTWAGTSLANCTIRVQIGQNSTIINLAAHGLGLQTDGENINLATYGANGAQALVSAATSLGNADPVIIHIEHDPASADRLYINGVLGATQSTAGDIPSTNPAATYYIGVSIARAGGAGTGSEQAIVSNLKIRQDN